MDPKTDGVDHINIYSKGKTWLGRELSNFAPLPQSIEVPIMSLTFNCHTVEGIWYLHRINDVMRTDPDSTAFLEKFNAVYDSERSAFGILQGSNGFEAKRAGKRILKALGIESDYSDWFKKTMTDVFKHKVGMSKDLCKALIESDLPFAHYYFYGTEDNPKVIPCNHVSWVNDAWEEIRKELKT